MGKPGRLAVAVGALVLAGIADGPLYHYACTLPAGVERADVTQFLRSGGYLPMWLGVAVVIALYDRQRVGRWSAVAIRRGMMLAGAVITAGLVAELAKLLFRRQRPSLSQGEWYAFRSFVDHPLSTGGLSMPSSHALIAFTGAMMLARFIPSATIPFLLYATGTALSRVYVGAHYLTDVYVSVILAILICVSFARVEARHGQPATLRPVSA